MDDKVNKWMIHIPCQVTLYAKKKKQRTEMDYWGGIHQGVFSEKVMFEERSECRAARRREALGRHDSKYKAQRGRNKLAPLWNFRKKIAWEEQSKQGRQRWKGAGIRRRGARGRTAGLQASENDASGGVLHGKYLEDGRWGCFKKSSLNCSAANSLGSKSRREECGAMFQRPAKHCRWHGHSNDEVRATGHEHCRRHPAPRPL